MIPKSLTAAATVVVALALTACGRDAATDVPRTAQAVSGGPATGTVTIWAQGTEGEALPEVLEAFEAANPEVDVRVTAVPWDEARNKYQTAVAGGAAPDIGMLGSDWMPGFRDALEPVPEGVDVSGMFPEAVASADLGGTRFGVPWYVETRVIFYRTDLVRQAGFDIFPTTWDGFRQLARALREKAGAKHGVNLPSGGWNTFLGLAPFFWSGGARITDGDTSEWTFDTPEMTAGLKYLDGFFDEGLADPNPDTSPGGAVAALVDGSVPMMISGPWDVGQVVEAGGPGFADRFALARIPGERSSTSLIAGSDLVVFEGAKNRDAAWKLVRWLSEPATQVEFFKATGDLPAQQAAWDDPALAQDPKVSVFGQQLREVSAAPTVTTWPEVSAAADTALEQVFRGGQDPATALRELQATADSIGLGR